MAQTERQSEGHPLQSERGTTTIQEGVVISIANAAAQEVDGIYLSHGGTRLPGDNSPTVGEFVDNIAGTGSRVRGISVEVGERQVAVDLTMNVDYGRPIQQLAESARRNVIGRIESLTGLEVTEVNVAVNALNLPSQ